MQEFGELLPPPAPSPVKNNHTRMVVTATIAGALVVICTGLLIIGLVGKSQADGLAADYQTASATYVKSLTTKDNKTVQGNLNGAPTLPGSWFAFLSPGYHAAQAKQAALAQQVTLLKQVSGGYTDVKNDMRRTLYYDQSSFFYDRYSARTGTYLKLEPNMPAADYAKIVITQYGGEAKAAKEYLGKLEKPAHQPLYTPEVTQLKATLNDYIKKADSCAADAKQKPAQAEDQAAGCNHSLNRYYYDTLMYYDYIGNFPSNLADTKPLSTLLATLKENQASDFSHVSVDEAKLMATTSTRVALIKTLLPTSNNDKQLGVKANVIRALNRQISDALDAAKLPDGKKAAYKQKLTPVIASLTLYDNPSGTKNGPDDAGGFVGGLTDIISAYEPRLEEDDATQYYAHYTAQIKKLKALKTPAYIKAEMKEIIAAYESSLHHFKEADALSKKSREASKLADEKSGSFEAVSYAIDALKYTRLSNKEADEGRAVIKGADAAVVKIGEKIDDTKAMTAFVTKQYDALLAAVR